MDVRTEKKQISMSELRKYLSDKEINRLATITEKKQISMDEWIKSLSPEKIHRLVCLTAFMMPEAVKILSTMLQKESH